ncbi:hypothetical protein PHJA_001191000 [Phtheirospermum japonicum]|uniref:Uncharacterized GPI-anchored protein At5g19230-like domain-containing protein n=1 Tax=Phtheirospermum japonicum TaxID=374723 RepID=A0A830C894_9LAMI|nr:hypothetical protein PHJA_001191000 [Phtheirospermum japonicum]
MVMKTKSFCYFQWIALCTYLLLPSLVCSKNHGNAANELLDIINSNRTAHKLPKLSDSPGLGCIALQYAQQCTSNCSTSSNSTMILHCRPQENDFTEIFAPNCGVELPTFGTISGYILGCQQKYLQPQDAFSTVLVRDKKTLSMLRNGTFTEAGVGVVGRGKRKGPYVWCVLFSNSETTNTTFVLEDLGKGIEQKRGCYSGETSLDCSGGGDKKYGVVVITSFVYFLFSIFMCW